MTTRRAVKPSRGERAVLSDGYPKLLTVEEVADIVRVKPAAIYSQRHRGEAPGCLGIRVGKRVLFRQADLDEFFSEAGEAQRAEVNATRQWAQFDRWRR